MRVLARMLPELAETFQGTWIPLLLRLVGLIGSITVVAYPTMSTEVHHYG